MGSYVASDKRLERHLIELVERNAYIRQPNAERRKLEKTNYKKGWEVRLVLRNEAEVEVARRLLEKSGPAMGAPTLRPEDGRSRQCER